MIGPDNLGKKIRPTQFWLVVAVLLASAFLAIAILNRTKPGSDKGRTSPGSGKMASPASSDRKAPWKANHKEPLAPEGEPSEVTPVLDQWMERNWEQDDAVLIDGLLGHADRADLGLAEKTRALEHALNLLPDTEYQKLDALLTSPSTSTHLLQQVFTDLHNRSERASLHACLRLLSRPEPEVSNAAKGFLAHWVDLDEESDTEAIRMQAETRLIELQEEPPPPDDQKEQDPSAPIPEGLRDASIPAPGE